MPSLRLSPAAPTLAFLVWHFISAAAPAQEPPLRRPDRPGLPPAERLDAQAGRPPHPPRRSSAQHRRAARQPPRTRGNVGLQRPRTRAHRPPGRKSRRSPGCLSELVRPGGNRTGRPHLVVGRRRQFAPHVPSQRSRAGSLRRYGANPEDPEEKRTAPFSRRNRPRRGQKALYCLDVDSGTVSALNLTDQQELKSAPAGSRPYDVALGRGGNQLFVSDWAGRVVRVLDPADLRTVAQHRRRRPSQSNRRLPDRRPHFRCLRVEQLRLGDRHAARGRDGNNLHRAFPERPKAAHPTHWLSHPTARRSSSQTPTTTTSR